MTTPAVADHHSRIRRRRQEHADRSAAARHRQPADSITWKPSPTRRASQTLPRCRTVCAPSASRASPSMWRTGSSRPNTRSYILADTPGHERYTRNMFTGASNAHVAILLVDARAGVLRQTRRHARIAKLLGIKHFVATVNKFDLVDFDQTRFDEVEARTAPGGGSPRRRRHYGDPDRRQTRRQRRAQVRQHALVRGAHPAGVSGERRAVRTATGGSQAAAAGAVGIAAVGRAAPPLHRPARRRARCRSVIRSSACPREPARLSPPSTRWTTTARQPLHRCRFRSNWPTTSTSAAATCSSAAPKMRCCRCRPASWTRRCAGSSTRPLRAGDRVALKQGARTVRATVQALHSRLDPETPRRSRQPSRVGAQRHRLCDAADQFGRRRRPLRR